MPPEKQSQSEEAGARLKAARASAPKKHKPPPKPAAPLPETHASLTARIDGLLERASKLDESCAMCSTTTLDRTIGCAVLEKLGDASEGKDEKVVEKQTLEFVRHFDKNARAAISKMEFRLLVRTGLSLKMDNTTIDGVFFKLTTGGTEECSLHSVSAALRRFVSEGLKAKDEVRALREDAEALRARIAPIKTIDDATMRYEQTVEHLNQLRGYQPLDARLGAIIATRNLKLADIFRDWDANGDGKLDKGEFLDNIMTLGVETDSQEAGALFDRFDADGSGELELEELKPAIHSLVDAAKHKQTQVDALAKQSAAARKQLEADMRALVEAEELAEQKIVERHEAKQREAEIARAEQANRRKVAKETAAGVDKKKRNVALPAYLQSKDKDV